MRASTSRRQRVAPALDVATEADLVRRLLLRLRNDWPVSQMAVEVRSHGRSRLDIGALVRVPAYAEPLVIGIEAKLANGGRAIGQAALNRYAVDASFIAMPGGRVSTSVQERAQAWGIGVLEVQRDSLRVSVPAVLRTPDASLRRRVCSQLARVRGRGTLDQVELVVEGEGREP